MRTCTNYLFKKLSLQVVSVKEDDHIVENENPCDTVPDTLKTTEPIEENYVQEKSDKAPAEVIDVPDVRVEKEDKERNADYVELTSKLSIESVLLESQESSVSEIPKSVTQVSIAQICEEPSAPSDFPCYGQIDIELPSDREIGEIDFPLSFEDCVRQVVEDQKHLSRLKPFTAEQSQAFYDNTLLEREAVIEESFLDSQKNLEVHGLFECLTRYKRCRLALKSTLDKVDELNREIKGLAAKLWTVENKKVAGYGECSDGRRVKAQDEYPVGHFNSSASTHLVRQLKQLRETIQEKIALEVLILYEKLFKFFFCF